MSELLNTICPPFLPLDVNVVREIWSISCVPLRRAGKWLGKKILAQPRHWAKKDGSRVSKVLNAVSESPDVPRAPVPRISPTSFPSFSPLLFWSNEANLNTFKSSFRGAPASLLTFEKYTRLAKWEQISLLFLLENRNVRYLIKRPAGAPSHSNAKCCQMRLSGKSASQRSSLLAVTSQSKPNQSPVNAEHTYI